MVEPVAATPRPPFRLDVQGLRAIAVVVVVAYHAHLPGFHAGFLGVDVFFVISGFVITNVLLRERDASGGTSILAFYARRIRRILPLATAVILVTVWAVYHWLGFLEGSQNATDALWVPVFLGNFHFASQGTNYFTSTLPPSALQQFWSLGVEEQFYVVWPVLFILVSVAFRSWNLRIKLFTILSIGSLASLVWCIVQTHSDPGVAFFSPFTRAWELGLGAMLAVAAPWLRDRAPRLGLGIAVAGVAIIAVSTWIFSSQTQWPGAAVILPVAATGAVIAAGTMRESIGSGRLVSSAPVQWTGKISYSLYLVHWPILIIAAEYAIHPLSTKTNLLLVVCAYLVSCVTYLAIENPLRRARFLRSNMALTYLVGAILIGLGFGTSFWWLHH